MGGDITESTLFLDARSRGFRSYASPCSSARLIFGFRTRAYSYRGRYHPTAMEATYEGAPCGYGAPATHHPRAGRAR